MTLLRSSAGVWGYDPDRRTLVPDASLQTLLGVDLSSGQSKELGLLDHIHEEDRDRLKTALSAAYEHGEAFEERVRIDCHDGSAMIVELVGRRFETQNGGWAVRGILQDVTGQLRQKSELAQLVREMNHRARNLVSVILSMIRGISGRDTSETVITARIEALGRTYGLLTRLRWTSVDLAILIEGELGEFVESGQVTLDGPAINLEPDDAQPLSILLHELATNAKDHGALSTATGGVHVSWRRTGDLENRIEFAWKERGGPTVRQPIREGFGLTVLEHMMPAQLQANVRTVWEAMGFSMTMDFALDPSLKAPIDTLASSGAVQLTPRFDRSRLSNKRALVVDDEWLLAEQHGDALDRAGMEVIGTFTRVEDALACDRDALDLAVLDFALRDTTTLELAKTLQADGVPIVFLSGYDLTEMLPAPLSKEVVLAKPVSEAALLDAAAAAVAAQG